MVTGSSRRLGVGEFEIAGPAPQIAGVGEQRLDPRLAPFGMRGHEIEKLAVGHRLDVEPERADRSRFVGAGTAGFGAFSRRNGV